MAANTAREALIVEVIGDIATLLDRVETLRPTIDASRQASVEASAQLAAALKALEGRMAGVTEIARTQVAGYITQRTMDAARRAQEVQSRAIETSAREAFGTQVERSIQRLTQAMQTAMPAKPPVWESWLTHAATAIAASVATWVLAVVTHAR